MSAFRRLDFVRRAVSGASGGGAPPRPRLLTYVVSFACNARCVMCDSWKAPRQDELTLPELERIFSQIPRLDSVRLTGGEPFVRQDLPEIAELARRHLQPLLLVVSTNGFLSDRVIEFCERRVLDLPLRLVVSLDGTEDEHDRIRGRERSFERAWATVEALAARRDALRLEISVNQTIIDDSGVDEYERLSARLRPLGVPHDAVIAYATSSTYTKGAPPITAPTRQGEFRTFGVLTRDAVLRLERLVRAGLDGRPASERAAKRYYLEGARRRLVDGVGDPSPRCAALGAHVRLFPDGSVPVCQFNGIVVGNLRRQSFDEVWRGATAVEQRAWVGGCPGCWAECEVLPSAIYSGDLARHTLRRLPRVG